MRLPLRAAAMLGLVWLLGIALGAPASEPQTLPPPPYLAGEQSTPIASVPEHELEPEPEGTGHFHAGDDEEGGPFIEIPSPWLMVTDGFANLPGLDDDSVAESKSRIPNSALGILQVPDRPALLLERNGDFLGNGELSQGIELSSGAVMRPSLWVFGTNRLAFQYFEDHVSTNALEIVDRLDLFTQLNLSGTERFLLGLRPFDHEIRSVRRYTSYDFTDGKFIDGVNLYPQTLFFEGDFGEIFPNLDLYDTKAIDYGFSIGRQPVFVQEGLFINADILDAITVTRNTLYGDGVLNSRWTFMYAPSWVHRNAGIPYYLLAKDAQMFAVLTETDFSVSTINANFAYVYSPKESTGDGVNFGLGAVQRLHPGNETINSAFHVLGSFPVEHETEATGNGVLLFGELSTTPPGTENVAYVTAFWAIGNYVSPTRGVQMGGPLSPAAGILFARPQIGVFGSPISNLTQDVAGGAVGYQFVWDGIRKQLTFEIGGRQSTSSAKTSAIGLGVLYQQAMGQHFILLLNGAVVSEEAKNSPAVGARLELLTKF